MATQVAVLISKIARTELKDWPELFPTLLKVWSCKTKSTFSKELQLYGKGAYYAGQSGLVCWQRWLSPQCYIHVQVDRSSFFVQTFVFKMATRSRWFWSTFSSTWLDYSLLHPWAVIKADILWHLLQFIILDATVIYIKPDINSYVKCCSKLDQTAKLYL